MNVFYTSHSTLANGKWFLETKIAELDSAEITEGLI